MRANRDGQEGEREDERERARRHRRAISRAALVAASAIAAACTDVLTVATSTDRSRLAVLLFQAGTPAPSGLQFYVSNARLTTRTLSHPDGFNTQFLQLRFPAGSIATIGGQTAGSSDSVLVTVTPEPGAYGFSLGVSGVGFSTSNPPTATFSYGRYGDFTASRAGTSYATATAYAQALEVWHEELASRFSVVPGSGSAGTDALVGSLTGGGTYLAAAPK